MKHCFSLFNIKPTFIPSCSFLMAKLRVFYFPQPIFSLKSSLLFIYSNILSDFFVRVGNNHYPIPSLSLKIKICFIILAMMQPPNFLLRAREMFDILVRCFVLFPKLDFDRMV